jgi:DNA-binding NarL/FixJ family response regulator
LVGDGLEAEFPPLRGAHSVDVIRVAIADDQALVRGGFAVLLRTAPDIEVVGEAADGRAAVELVIRERPDVVLMDIRMPDMDGVEATRRITGDARLATTRVLILTTYDLDEYVFEALRAGASGFLLKDTLPDDLLAAVRVIAKGEALLAPQVTRRLLEEVLRHGSRPAASSALASAQLTPRETEVLAAVARGLSNTEIAATLFMSHATAKTHVSRLLAKLHARDRAQLVVIAYEAGVVAPGGR